MRANIARLVLVSILAGLVYWCAATAPADPLQWTVGTWKGVRHAADGAPDAPMTLHVESLPGGQGQMECLRVEDSSGPYIGSAVRLIDAGRWTMVYANSTQHPFARLQGEIDGTRSTWTSTTAEPPRGLRLVFEQTGPNCWKRTQFVSEDGGAAWRVLFTDELERDTTK